MRARPTKVQRTSLAPGTLSMLYESIWARGRSTPRPRMQNSDNFYALEQSAAPSRCYAPANLSVTDPHNSLRAAKMPSEGLRGASEGSSMRVWDTTVGGIL